jgi:hypothetical protein
VRLVQLGIAGLRSRRFCFLAGQWAELLKDEGKSFGMFQGLKFKVNIQFRPIEWGWA